MEKADEKINALFPAHVPFPSYTLSIFTSLRVYTPGERVNYALPIDPIVGSI